MATVKYKDIKYELKRLGPYNQQVYKNEKGNMIYDLGHNSNFTYVNNENLINPIYIIIDNYIELVYSFENNQLIIVDNSARTNQQYILSDCDRGFLDTLRNNLRTLKNGLYNEHWTNYLQFNKASLKVLRNNDYEQFMLHSIIHNKEYIFISYKNYCYEYCAHVTPMDQLYNGLQLLYNIIIEKLNTDYNYNIQYDNEKLWGED